MNNEKKSNKVVTVIIVIIIALVLAFSAVIISCITGVQSNSETVESAEEQTDEAEDGYEQTEATTLAPLADDDEEEETKPIEELQVGLTDIELSDEITAELNELNAACTKFYDERKEEALLVSEYGMLYSLTKEDIVTVDLLRKNDYFKGSDVVKSYVDLLLIRPEDYAEVSGKAAEGTELKVFSGFNSKDGYYVSSDGIEGAMLTPEQYNDLLFRYICAHGDIVLPESNYPDYKKIVSALAVSDIDVKFVSYDEKYAVAVTGSLTDPREIRQFLLQKIDGSWKKVLDGIESAASAKQYINLQYPDADFGLLPAYNIADFDVPKTDMTDYVSSLQKLGMMDDLETCTYGCGTGHFVYMETSSDRILLGVLDDNRKLNFYEMESAEDAKNAMLNIQNTAPTYIIKYN